MKILPHRIRKNHSARVPSVHMALGCASYRTESDSGHGPAIRRLAAWFAESFRWESMLATRRKYADGDSPGSLWPFIEANTAEDRTLWIWSASAPSTWQLCGIYGALDDGRLTLKSCSIGGRTNILSVKWRGRNIVLLDVANWYRLPLADVAAMHGIRLPCEPGESAGLEDWQALAAARSAVCSRVAEAICGRVKADDLGTMRPTCAAQSWQAFTHNWMDHPIEVHGRADISAAERLAYYGGRVIQGYRGVVASTAVDCERLDREHWPHCPTTMAGPVHYLDAQSLYPAIMAQELHPWRCVGRFYTRDLCKLAQLMKQYWCIARVRIRTDGEQYPVRVIKGTLDKGGDYYATDRPAIQDPVGSVVLPPMQAARGRAEATPEGQRDTVYCTGDFWTVLCNPELRQAMDRGRVCDVDGVVVYLCADLFGAWVRYWFARRSAAVAGSADQCVIKTVMSALYGMFAAHGERWRRTKLVAPHGMRWGNWHHFDWPSKRLITRRVTAGVVYERIERPGEGFNAMVAISAGITSHGRVRMQRWIDRIPARSLVYSDTDSLHVLPGGYTALNESGDIVPGQLGALREKGRFSWGVYLGPKVYYHADGETVGGSAHGARRVGPTTWKVTYTEGSQRLATRAPTEEVSESEVLRDYCNGKLPGIAGPDGWVRPFFLDRASASDED